MAERMNKVVNGIEARRLLGLSKTRYSAIRNAMRRAGHPNVSKGSRFVNWREIEAWMIQHPDFNVRTVYPSRASAQSETSSGRNRT